ncbi:MAG: hypothetical protein R3E98_14935 [Gemmatimonadota bacterium]
MRVRFASFALLATLAACGGASGPGAPAPGGALSIRMPPAAEASFVKNDTVVVEVDTGVMGTIAINGHSDATVGLSFTEDPAGFRATARYEALQAAMDNPMGGTSQIGTSDVEGTLVFTVGPRGEASVHERFQVEGQAAQMVGNVSLAHEFFLRLPDRSVGVGDSWVDTLTVDETMEGVRNTNTTVTRYAITGDTTVAGTRLLRITTESDVEMVAEGTMQGMSMSQTLSGTSSGWLLWDPQAALLQESWSSGELSGAMVVDMPGAPDMTMSLTQRSHTRRAEP